MLYRRVLLALVITVAAGAQEIGPLGGLAELRDATSKRASSWDRSGGNADAIPIQPGETATLAEVPGAGSIRHIWVTIASPSNYHLREIVLRMYWDGEAEPSVEAPIGDFFGTGFGAYHSWHSLPITVQGRAMNCYFAMPFARGARITATNEGKQPVRSFYYHVDYEQYRDATRVRSQGRFHAQFRRADPTPAVALESSQGKNLTGRDNYRFMEAEGQGHFVGIVLNIQGYSTGWWGEGDDMFFIDGERWPPSLHGTGLEDYFNNAWGFQDEFNYPFIGYSLKGNRDFTGMHTMYRFHIQDPVYFHKSLVAGIEHGHANDRADDYSSVAYWYQTEPHKKLEALPPVGKRMPHPFWKVEVLEKNLPN